MLYYAAGGVPLHLTTLSSLDNRHYATPTLNHKQTLLLFDFVSKMKTGATKNLLTQRLKEL